MIKTYREEIRIRYSETDAMGIVHHANYVHWLELARTEWLRKNGQAYEALEASGIQIPVLALELKYIKSCYFGQVVEVQLWPEIGKSARFQFLYELRVEGELVTKGSSQHVFLKGQKPIRPPEWMLVFSDEQK